MWHVYAVHVAQVTIYLRTQVAAAVRKRAKLENKSVSGLVSELVTRATLPSNWPDDFVALLRDGQADLIEPSDPPPEAVEPLP